MANYEYIIAIDPDCEKSGFAWLEVKTKSITVMSLDFPSLIDKLINGRGKISNTIVVVEAGWLNESNWHLGKYDSKRVAAAKGNAVGRNHETGRKIIEMCKHHGIDVVEQKPLKKCWGSNDGKITHEEIAYFINGFPNRSNQEVRDAALIAWNYAGFPIRVNSKVRFVKGRIYA